MQNTSKSSDPDYLQRVQYFDAANLTARIRLHRQFTTNSEGWEAFVYSNLPDLSGKRVLALGCGSAVQWRANRHRFAADAEFVLTDLSEGMLAEARAGLDGDPRFSLLQMDASVITFADNSFDFVTANHMLYHVPGIDQTLAEAARVLKPDGTLMAATNGAHYMSDFDCLLTEFWQDFEGTHTMSVKFNLQNGADLLRSWFDVIEKVIYPGDLWVTEAQPLVDFAYSTPQVQELIPISQKEPMRDFFQARIDRDGGVRIRKETGLFLARQPKKA